MFQFTPGTRYIVVPGRSHCSAVAAACEVVEKKTLFPVSIDPMIDAIKPAAQAIRGKPEDFVNEAVRGDSARAGNRNTNENPSVCRLLEEVEVKVIASRCDLEDDRVEFFA